MSEREEGGQSSLDALQDHPLPQQEGISPPRTSWRFKFLRWFTARENIAVCILAMAVLAAHLVVLGNPPQEMFDEAHYVPEARSFLHGQGINRPEHAPLAKWMIALGMLLFGDNAVGWRAFSLVFGIAAIFIFYFICVRLTREQAATTSGGETGPPPLSRGAGWFRMTTFLPVLATFLFASENMSFVQAHIAMLDVFYVTFMLLAFLLYLRGNFLASGAVMGLSMLAKPMALLGILAILFHWALSRRSELAAEIRFTIGVLRGRKGVPPPRSHLLDMVKLLACVAVVWMALLPLLEYPATHQWLNPVDRTWYMLSTHVSLTSHSATTGIATQPWLWPVYPAGLFYWYTPHYLGSIGWTIWALIIPSIGYLVYEAVRRRAAMGNLPLFTLCWLAGVYLLLIPLELATDRLMYVFYFYPAIPAVCLAIAWGSWRLWGVARKGKKARAAFLWVMLAYLVATVVAFVLMSPYGQGLVTIPTMG
ncbi:MAG: glycosyltransferase family 39 protein [Chloroflexota bacterium]